MEKDIVNPSTIRTIIQAVKNNLQAMFPDRYSPSPEGGEGRSEVFEVPKTLIFANSDFLAEDIIEKVQEEFGEENIFCKKITYKNAEYPKTVLSQFRNDYYTRVAVMENMIATGTDIRPLKVVLFIRDVKSRSNYGQMKSRGTRTCSLEQLKDTGTPSAKFTKGHFVIIDAIEVESSQKTDSRPLEKKPGMSLKELLQNVAMGNTDVDIQGTLANRLLRLDKQINENEKTNFAVQANGCSINQMVRLLLNGHDPDTIQSLESVVRSRMFDEAPVKINAEIKNNLPAMFPDRFSPHLTGVLVRKEQSSGWWGLLKFQKH